MDQIVGVVAAVVAIAPFGGEVADPVVDIAFLAGMLPKMLLTASVPLLVIGSDVLGRNGLGVATPSTGSTAGR